MTTVEAIGDKMIIILEMREIREIAKEITEIIENREEITEKIIKIKILTIIRDNIITEDMITIMIKTMINKEKDQKYLMMITTITEAEM